MKLQKSTVATAIALVALTVAFLARTEEAAGEQEGASEEPIAELVGTYNYSKSAGHGRGIVREAMEKAVQQLSAILRPLGRRKMRSMSLFNPQIIIARPDNRIVVTLVGEETLTFDTRPGVQEKARFWGGEEVEVTQRIVKNRLVQTINGSKKQATFTYALLPDGRRLSMHSKLAPRMLDSPIEWRLVYSRQ